MQSPRPTVGSTNLHSSNLKRPFPPSLTLGNLPTLALSTLTLTVALLLRYSLSFKRLVAILKLEEVPLQEAEILLTNVYGISRAKDDPAAMATRFIDGISTRLFPHRPCLTAAIAARLILQFRRFDSILVLGVKKDESNQLLAHAWLQTAGNIVVAGRDYNLDEYKVVGLFVTRREIIATKT